MIRAQFIIRALLTIGLLYMVHKETGVWTVLTLAFVCASVELLCWSARRRSQ